MERQRAFFSPLTLRSRSLGFVRPPADGYLLDVRQIIVCADAASAAKVVIVVRHPDGRADNVRMKPDLALLAGVHAHLEHIAARLANALAQRHYERPRLAAAALHETMTALWRSPWNPMRWKRLPANEPEESSNVSTQVI